MVIIVSSYQREGAALSGVCESRGWTTVHADSIRRFDRLLQRWTPKVVIVRQKLNDGYSDDVLGAFSAEGDVPAPKFIVLIAANASSSLEARQVTLGADCVFRDPVRTDVLIEYISKYMASPPPSPTKRAAGRVASVPFAGATLHATDRLLVLKEKKVAITPREVELIELLAEAENSVVTYEMLYSEIIGRKFQGDTSNMRVLLGKVAASAKRLGIELRDWVQVIPKLGYRYRPGNSR